MLIEPMMGSMSWRMSRTCETPSSPSTALTMPWYSSGSLSSTHSDWGMSSTVAAGLSPSNFSAPRAP